MPDLTFLHVQGCDGTPTRVFELPAGPVRVGRGPQCEVQIAGADLADVECVLRPQGDAWHLQPLGPPGQVWVDGRPADARRPLVFGVPFRIGDEWLTLRSPENATNDWGTFAAPITIGPADAEAPAEPIRPIPAAPDPERARPTATGDVVDDRVRRWQSRVEARERWLKDQQEERRWEARWKAAGETIRARAAQPSPSPRTPTTPPAPRTMEARDVVPRPAEPLRRVPGPERRPLPPREPIRTRPVAPPERPAPGPQARLALHHEPSKAPPAIPEPSRGLVAIAPAPALAPAPVDVEVGPESTEAASPGPAAEWVAVEPTVEVAPAPVEVAAIAERPPLLEAEWEDLPPFVSENFESAPNMVRVEPTEWPDPDESEPGEVVPVVAPRTMPEPVAAPAAEPALRDIAAGPDHAGIAWPSARVIFASQGRREVASPEEEPARRRPSAPEPTIARPPAHWSIPLWLGWFPTTALVLAVGVGALGLSAVWVGDATGGDLAERLALRPEGTAGPTIDVGAIPRGAWWRTTAPHLAAWAVAVGRIGDGEDHSAEVRELLEDASNASRLAARSRFVVEAPTGAEAQATGDLSHLGRPRDVVALAGAGRKLRHLGKPEAATRAYRSAYVIASGAALSDLPTPAFDDNNQVKRYALPHESILAVVARDMADAGAWTAEEWAEALPPFTPAHLAAARALRPKDPAGADRVLDLATRLADQPAPAGLDAAEHRAGGAEALAIRGRWTDAAAAYRLAIDGARDDATRRTWSLNLAEVCQRLGDFAGRSRALEAAKDVELGDEVTCRALQLSQTPGHLAEQARRP